jgi:hypothetical protein
MERRAALDNDSISGTIACKLRHLLSVEAAVTKGTCFSTSVTSSSVGAGGITTDNSKENSADCKNGDRGVEDSGKLEIDIPHFGTIRIERHGITAPVSVSSGISRAEDNKQVYCQPPLTLHAMKPTELQTEHSGQLPDSGQTDHEREVAAAAVLDGGDVPGSSNFFLQEESLCMAGLEADSEDWALQGVDMALFDSFIRGASWLTEG